MQNAAPPEFDPKLPDEVLLCLPSFGMNSNVKLWPRISTSAWGGGLVRLGGGDENCANLNILPTFLFDFLTHYRPILRHLATIHNAAYI